MQHTPSIGDETGSGWRFKCGVALLVLAIALVLAIPLLATLGVPAATLAAVTGAVFIINKLLLILIIALVGKAGFQQLKNAVASHIPRLGTVGPIGPVRHAIGLAMFWVPLTWSLLEPYIDYFWPGWRPNQWAYQLLGDLIFITGIFVLGGNFWEKVRALFIRTARVVDTASH
ncbi:hypothetical protein C7I85_17090 [Mesorhizobium soli]|uniref:Transporter suffix domain-containing protein n=2 Tax=Pseudaminobacter soli (ex Li et al. 2025) TaxID=1295366 RepID=A0A2P7SAE5_9HYPH|nr:hypothetical protein C7I85_17090 [Mesorhizobium soli]